MRNSLTFHQKQISKDTTVSSVYLLESAASHIDQTSEVVRTPARSIRNEMHFNQPLKLVEL